MPYIVTAIIFILSSLSTEGACPKNNQVFFAPKKTKDRILNDTPIEKTINQTINYIKDQALTRDELEHFVFSLCSKLMFKEENPGTLKFKKLKKQITTSQKKIAQKIDTILDDPNIKNKSKKIEAVIKKNYKNKRSKQDQNSHQKLAEYAFYTACRRKPGIRTVQNLWESVEELLSDDERERVFREGITYCMENPYSKEDKNVLDCWVGHCKVFFDLQKLLCHHNHHRVLKPMILDIAKKHCYDSTESILPENHKQFVPELYEEIMLVYRNHKFMDSNKIFKTLANECVYNTCLSTLLIHCIRESDLFHFQILVKAPKTDVLKPGSKIAKGLVPIFATVSHKKMFRLSLYNVKARGHDLKKTLPTLKDSDDHTLLQLAIGLDKFTTTYGLVKKYGFQREKALQILTDRMCNLYNEHEKASSQSDENNCQGITENDYPNKIKANLFVYKQLTKLTKSCMHCGKTAHTKQSCKKCKAVYYCSQKCQKKHWPIHKEKIWIHKETGLPLMNYPGSDYSFEEGVSFLAAPSYGIANKIAGMIRDYTLTAKEIEQKGPQLKQVIFTNLFEQTASSEEKKQRKHLKKQGFVPVAFCVAFQKLFAQGRQHCIKG